MLKKYLAVTALGLLLLPVTSFAQKDDAARFTAGDKEFTITGSGTSDKHLRSNDIAVNASLGYFFIDSLEASIRQAFEFINAPGGDSWAGSTTGAVDLHLPLGRFYPFVGANIGYQYGHRITDQFVGGPEGGVKLFLNDTTFLLGQIQYRFLFRSDHDVENDFRNGSFVYSIGLGLKF